MKDQRNDQVSELTFKEKMSLLGQAAKRFWRKIKPGFFMVLRRTGLCLGTLVLLLVVGLCLVLNLIFNGPSEAASVMLTNSLHEASATKWVPPLFIGKDRFNEVLHGGSDSPLTTLPPVSNNPPITIKPPVGDGENGEWKNYPDGVRIEEVEGKTFKGYVMIIRDPSKVYMATSSEKFSMDVEGTRITNEIDTQGAIAAINAGAFYDNGTTSSVVGSVPEGLVVAGGKVVWDKVLNGVPEEGFVGFNKDNVLVVAQSMPAKKAMELNIRDGCCFGPVLVMNGQINEKEYNANSGLNPRTAIGQRADGAVLFVCVDGRSVSALGATYTDMIDIMIQYGAVNACNLDGGSSTVMLYRDQYGRYDGSENPRYGKNNDVIMVNNYSLLQHEPRRMPNFFMVRPAEEVDD